MFPNYVQDENSNKETIMRLESDFHESKYKIPEVQILEHDEESLVELEILGQGASSEVKKFYDLLENDYVALKYPLKKTSNDEVYQKMFNQEDSILTIIKSLNSDGNLKYYGMFKERKGERLLLKIECGFASFENLIEVGRKYDEEEAFYILKELAFAGEKLQEHGIYNGDIKPANIILTKENKENEYGDYEFKYKFSDYGAEVRQKILH